VSEELKQYWNKMLESGPKGSSFNKIIAPGFSDDDKRVVLGDLKESFENPPKLEGELEKTPDEEKAIELANWITSQIIRSLGLDPLEIPSQNVKVLSTVEIGDRDYGGEMEPLRQILKLERSDSGLVTLVRTIHEMLHMKSFGAFQTLPDNSSGLDFNARSGLAIKSRDGFQQFFWRLNEAITEYLTRAAYHFVAQERKEVFSQELASTEESKRDVGKVVDDNGEDVPTDDIYFATTESGDLDGKSFVYRKERQVFDLLVSKLYERLKSVFESEDDVREQFYIAYFSGNNRVLAQMVDGSFGKGTFRKIGETRTAKEFERVVDLM
jgi:hypothetical protein